MYLLDSISKVVGKPYTIYFGLNLFKVFTDAYTLVPDSTRRKMYELFLTWKQPSQNGTQLFGSVPMNKLEHFLNQAQAKMRPSQQPTASQLLLQQQQLQTSQAQQANPKYQNIPQKQQPLDNINKENPRPDVQAQLQKKASDGPLSQNNLLSQVDGLLGLTEQRKTADPSDSSATLQLEILNKLKDELKNKVFTDSVLKTIQQQLTTFTNEELERLKSKKEKNKPIASPSISSPALATSSNSSSSIPSSPKNIPTGPAASSTISHRKKNKMKQQQQQQPLPQFNQYNNSNNNLQQQQGSSNSSVYLTPDQVQQLLSMMNQPAATPPPQQQYPVTQSNFQNTNTLLTNPYFLNSMYGNLPQQQQNQSSGMYANSPNYQIISALQGIANMQVGNPQQALPVQPKPYEAPSFPKQSQSYNIPSYLPQPQPYSGMAGATVAGKSGRQGGAGQGSGGAYSYSGLPSQKQHDNPTSLQSIDLTLSSLQKPRPDLIGNLYSSMPKLCSTCGKRFPDSPEGRRVREAHLDWHFRVNKKLREENWTQVRSWFLSEDEWIKYRDESEVDNALNGGNKNSENNKSTRNNAKSMTGGNDRSNNPSSFTSNKFGSRGGQNSGSSNTVVGKQQGGSGASNGSSGSKGGNSGSGSNRGPSLPSLAKLSPAEIKSTFVRVPLNKHTASLPCPICREKFVLSFNDVAEEWVWKNALEVQGKYFHATCYAEAERGGDSFLKRIIGNDHEGGNQNATVGSSNINERASPGGAAEPQSSAVNNNSSSIENSNTGGIGSTQQVNTNSSNSTSAQQPVLSSSSSSSSLLIPGGIDMTAILATVKRKREESETPSVSKTGSPAPGILGSSSESNINNNNIKQNDNNNNNDDDDDVEDYDPASIVYNDYENTNNNNIDNDDDDSSILPPAKRERKS